MPGFVDVTGWSPEQVKRLGHMDDVDEPVRGRARSRRAAVTITADQAWALAVAVDRVNGGYHKQAKYDWNEGTQQSVLVREANKTMMYRMVESAGTEYSEADIQAGRELRNALSQELVLAALRGELTGFQKAQQTVVTMTEFSSADRLNLAILAAQPNSQRVSAQRHQAADRLRGTRPLIDREGTRVRVTGEVIKCNWSEKWGTFYVTMVTEDGFQVYFANRQSPAIGSTVTAEGAVKRHGQDSTQLNRVRLAV